MAVRYRDDLEEHAPKRIYRGDLVECLRWADRTVGILVRRGQRGPDAWIASRGSNLTDKENPFQKLVVAKSFFHGESNYQAQAFVLADAPEIEFEQALERAKGEGNLSRTNVVKCLSDRVPPSRASDRPEHLRKTRRVDVRRVLDESINTLKGVALGLEVLDDSHWDNLELSPKEVQDYIVELNDLVGAIRSFRERVRNVSRSASG